MSKNEKDVFLKEQCMGIRLASFGFHMEHLYEQTGISSPDVIINGYKADLKQLSSANNIYAEGKDAFEKKKASLLIYEFTEHFSGIKRALEKLSEKGIHGLYYYSDEKEYYLF